MIPNHAIGFVGCKFPNRQTPGLLVLLQEGHHKIPCSLGGQPGPKRMQGAVGIPQGEHRVVIKTLGTVDQAIPSTVTTIGIACQTGVNHATVQSRVKSPYSCSIRVFNFDHPQGLVPGLSGGGLQTLPYLDEFLVPILGRLLGPILGRLLIRLTYLQFRNHVQPCPLLVHAGYRDFDPKFPVRTVEGPYQFASRRIHDHSGRARKFQIPVTMLIPRPGIAASHHFPAISINLLHTAFQQSVPVQEVQE